MATAKLLYCVAACPSGSAADAKRQALIYQFGAKEGSLKCLTLTGRNQVISHVLLQSCGRKMEVAESALHP